MLSEGNFDVVMLEDFLSMTMLLTVSFTFPKGIVTVIEFSLDI